MYIYVCIYICNYVSYIPFLVVEKQFKRNEQNVTKSRDLLGWVAWGLERQRYTVANDMVWCKQCNGENG